MMSEEQQCIFSLIKVKTSIKREEKQIRLTIYVIFPWLGFNYFFIFFPQEYYKTVKSLTTEEKYLGMRPSISAWDVKALWEFLEWILKDLSFKYFHN